MSHEDDDVLAVIPGSIVGYTAFVDWLFSIGIATSDERLRITMKANGIPRLQDEGNLNYSVFTKPLIKRYIRALTGVSPECWLAERKRDRESGAPVEVYRPNSRPRKTVRKGRLYAAISIGRVQGDRNVERVHYDFEQKRLFVDWDEAAVAKWDLSRVPGRVSIYRYGQMVTVPPERTITKKIRGLPDPVGHATTLLCPFYVEESGRQRRCEIGASFLGYDEGDRGLLPCVVPYTYPPRTSAMKEVIRAYPDAWVWIWTQGWPVRPVTLEPYVSWGMRSPPRHIRKDIPNTAQMVNVEDLIEGGDG